MIHSAVAVLVTETIAKPGNTVKNKKEQTQISNRRKEMSILAESGAVYYNMKLKVRKNETVHKHKVTDGSGIVKSIEKQKQKVQAKYQRIRIYETKEKADQPK